MKTCCYIGRFKVSFASSGAWTIKLRNRSAVLASGKTTLPPTHETADKLLRKSKTAIRRFGFLV